MRASLCQIFGARPHPVSLRASGIVQVIVISVLLLLVGGVICALKYVAALEQPSKFYSTYQDAKQDGAVTRGWIPSFVPTSAFQIHEKHDLDSNAHWLKFRFPPADGKAIVARATKLDRGQSRSPRSRPNASWWQVEGNSRLEIYQLPVDGGYLAVDWTQSEAYYWNQ
jgi:hypothetical protein